MLLISLFYSEVAQVTGDVTLPGGWCCTLVLVITVQCLNVQQQRGGSDCGLFALAFITAVCHGDDPTSLYFDQENMRSHLITSIESGEATPFPVIKKQTRRKRLVDTVHINLHCVCRLPDNGTPMIKCDECLGWFHTVCVNAVLGEKPWSCQTCIQH